MSELTLYNFDLDENCYRVRLLLGMLGIACKLVSVDMVPGFEHKKAPLLALNPLGDLPILADGDFVVNGFVPSLIYVARRAGASAWAPSGDARTDALLASWLAFAASELKSAREARLVSLFGFPGDLKALRGAGRGALRVMEDHMTRRSYEGAEFFVSGNPTIADLALLPAFALSRDWGVGHEGYPALRRWLRRVRTLPGFKTMPGVPDYY